MHSIFMKSTIKLSVALAVYNEEENLAECLETVKDIADEIVIVDGGSSDKTVEIAHKFNARIQITSNPRIFHINKQKALEMAKNTWILQLDADERVTKKLAEEILMIISLTNDEIKDYQRKIKDINLFTRHQKLLEERDGVVGRSDSDYAAFFIPRRNFFLGRFLRYGGTYPDGVIRLVKKNKAHFPCLSVHEQIKVDGNAGWLESDLLHMADPTFKRYLTRNNKYINLLVDELRQKDTEKNLNSFIKFFFIRPIAWFFWTQIRHKGILDGIPGIIFSFFSALRFPRAYYRYLKT